MLREDSEVIWSRRFFQLLFSFTKDLFGIYLWYSVHIMYTWCSITNLLVSLGIEGGFIHQRAHVGMWKNLYS
mgnify:FL=1